VALILLGDILRAMLPELLDFARAELIASAV